MKWTTPADLRAQVEKLWQQGKLLASLATNSPLFPRRLVFSPPTALEMVSHFDAVRAWIRELQDTPYCRIETRSFRHRELGNNAVPAEAWIDSFDHAVALIGKQSQAARFAAMLGITAQRQPEWISWLARKPLQALELAADWDRFLDIATWCQEHPRPGIYLRQMDLPGVDTKFIESHRGPLAELLDLALPVVAVDRSASGAGGFDARYGFRERPVRIRFRVLDHSNMPTWLGEDITITADSFATLDPPVDNIFITENEINFLAFPLVKSSLIVFGAGYGVELLRQANWLSDRRIYYWGDIDTHGFAILDKLRHRFEHVTSFLMDHETFMTFKDLWGVELVSTKCDLTSLTNMEQSLYDDLRDNRFGKNLRLEQERIGFSWVESRLANI